MINLISTFYLSKYNNLLDNERTNELIQALMNNLNSDIIKKIHLFIDENDTLEKLNEIKSNNINSDKIVIIYINKQPTYHDFFNYSLNNLPNQICMISNSNIYLNLYDINLINLLNYEKYCYALTRYEHDMKNPLIDNYLGSHDCYIFNSKFLDNRIICENTNFKQNLPGIETRIIKSFCDLNYKVFNPCKQIKIVHLHKTNLRNYNINNWIGLHKYGDNETFKNSCWCIPPSILSLNIILENKEYSWGEYFIKFLKNNKMEAFGDGNYKIKDNFNIIANFGGRIHNIKFSNDYSEFTSIRKDDSCIVKGKILYTN